MRENDTVDVVFTNDAGNFTNCQSIIMALITDHKMITFNINDDPVVNIKISKTVTLLKFWNTF